MYDELLKIIFRTIEHEVFLRTDFHLVTYTDYEDLKRWLSSSEDNRLIYHLYSVCSDISFLLSCRQTPGE